MPASTEAPKLIDDWGRAGDQMDSADPRRFLSIEREQAIASKMGGPGRWSIDHLFLDQDGVPTLVEVKRTPARLRAGSGGQGE